MRVYLLRHGQTAYNAVKKYQGVRDIPLSPEGEDELCEADISPEAVYVTPLVRTQQTANRLFPGARHIVVPDFREMDFGAFEGRNYLEMEHDADYRAWVDGGCEGRCPGGESRKEFSDRVCAAFVQMMDQAVQDGTPCIVIVAHGGTQMAVMERYALPQRPYFAWCGPTAGGYVLDTTPERWMKERKLTLMNTVQYTQKGGAT